MNRWLLSIDLKTSWMDMESVSANLRSRYYIKKAWVLDPASDPANPKCTQRDMGLLGMHIVSKTPTRDAAHGPQWIWSTFEQIDNVPVVDGATPTTNSVFNLNDGSGTPMPANDPYCAPQPGNPSVFCPGNPPPPAAMPADASQAARFNVTRTKRIGTGPENTPAANSAYQKLLAAKAPSSPWQYYQLVMTQWPFPGSSPSNPGTPDFTIPGRTTANSSFSNVTLETFDQGSIFGGCMNCHNITAASGDDFLWSLAVNAYPDAMPAPGAETTLRKRPSGFSPSSIAAFEALSAMKRDEAARNLERK